MCIVFTRHLSVQFFGAHLDSHESALAAYLRGINGRPIVHEGYLTKRGRPVQSRLPRLLNAIHYSRQTALEKALGYPGQPRALPVRHARRQLAAQGDADAGGRHGLCARIAFENEVCAVYGWVGRQSIVLDSRFAS